jgi:hypothetical protein
MGKPWSRATLCAVLFACLACTAACQASPTEEIGAAVLTEPMVAGETAAPKAPEAAGEKQVSLTRAAVPPDDVMEQIAYLEILPAPPPADEYPSEGEPMQAPGTPAPPTPTPVPPPQLYAGSEAITLDGFPDRSLRILVYQVSDDTAGFVAEWRVSVSSSGHLELQAAAFEPWDYVYAVVDAATAEVLLMPSGFLESPVTGGAP